MEVFGIKKKKSPEEDLCFSKHYNLSKNRKKGEPNIDRVGKGNTSSRKKSGGEKCAQGGCRIIWQGHRMKKTGTLSGKVFEGGREHGKNPGRCRGKPGTRSGKECGEEKPCSVEWEDGKGERNRN